MLLFTFLPFYFFTFKTPFYLLKFYRFIQEIIVEDDHSCHSFDNRYCTRQDTWIMTTTGFQ